MSNSFKKGDEVVIINKIPMFLRMPEKTPIFTCLEDFNIGSTVSEQSRISVGIVENGKIIMERDLPTSVLAKIDDTESIKNYIDGLVENFIIKIKDKAKK